MAATVARFGEETTGLAVTEDGRLLRDLVAADCAAWLGPEAAAAQRSSPADTGILVKLLDAQDSDWMLSRMHRVPVRPGDGIVVPAG